MTSQRPGPRPRAWRIPAWRLAGFGALLLVALLAMLARLVYVQIIQGERYRAAAQANQVRLIPVAAPRGTVYDRHGAVVARSRPSFAVALIPSEVTDARREIATLARVLGVDERPLWYRLLHHRGIDYEGFDAVVAAEPYGPVMLAADLPVAAVARVSEVLNDLPGVDLEVQPIRDYPDGPAGSHVIGYVGAITQGEYEHLKHEGYSPNDVIGKDGLEFSYDKYLRGTPGGELLAVKRDSGEVLVPFVSAIVTSVSLDEGTLEIEPPDGLLDLE